MRKFIIGVKNLIKWFKVIWNDRDYHHDYLEVMMLKKLKGMKVSIETYNQVRNGKKYHDWYRALKICITILERRTSCFYNNLQWKNIEVDTCFPDNMKVVDSRLTFVENPKYNSSQGERLKVQTKSAESIEKRDQEVLGKLIGIYLSHWWD